MVSFQRFKDEIDGLGNHITTRVPVLGKSGCLTISVIGLILLFIIGIAIGYGSHRVNSNSDGIRAAPLQLQQPNYVFVSNTSGSCPALSGERLLTTMKHGDSFEGNSLLSLVFPSLSFPLVLCLLYIVPCTLFLGHTTLTSFHVFLYLLYWPSTLVLLLFKQCSSYLVLTCLLYLSLHSLSFVSCPYFLILILVTCLLTLFPCPLFLIP